MMSPSARYDFDCPYILSPISHLRAAPPLTINHQRTARFFRWPQRCLLLNTVASMKILVADKISPAGVQFLRQNAGFEVIEAYGSDPAKVVELAKEASAIIVRSETKVSREVLASATQLKAVGRAGVGVDNIDLEAATEKGVVVMNTPSGNTIATAELTLTHMLCACRPVPQAYASMIQGSWDRKVLSGVELNGKTLAVLGMGRIGSEVAKRAKAFGMRVLAYDPFLTEHRAKSLGVELLDFESAIAGADLITVHMPLTEKTRHMINARTIQSMRDGVRLFNCARGGIIDEGALIEGLQSGKVAAAGLDVYEKEPLPADHPLRKAPNLILTPHLGASTSEAQESVGLEIAEAIADVLRGGVVRNAINMPSVDARTLEQLRPYLVLGEKLGGFIQQFSPDQVESLHITYQGRIIELDAMPLTRAIQKGYLIPISGGEINDVNAPLKMEGLGIEVSVTKSNTESDYNELIRLEAKCSDGKTYSVAGTLLGKGDSPRMVELNGRDLEMSLSNTLLILENHDRPGIVGMLGTALGEAGVNIATMSLSRASKGDFALSVFELDSEPGEEALEKLSQHEAIQNIRLIRI